MALVLDWKKKLGYTEDPFAEEVKHPVRDYIVGTKPVQEKFNLFLIKNQQFGTVAAEEGMGKSTFLEWIAEELERSGKNKAHYLNAKYHGTQTKLLDAFVRENFSFFTRSSLLKKPAEAKYEKLIVKLAKNNHVLLIDNASNLSKEASQLLASIMTKTPTHILFADTKANLKKLGLSGMFEDKLKVTIKEYTKENLMDMIKYRIEGAGSVGIFPFKEKELEKLIKKANHNPKKLLHITRDKAIELSLKVTELPEPPAKVISAERRGRLFSIKIQRGGEDMEVADEQPEPGTTKEPRPPVRTVKKKEAPVAIEPLSEETQHDADMLSEIIETTANDEPDEVVVVEEKKPKKKRKTKDDKLIADLLGEKKKKR
ncbi:MAG: ATP-binding protein [Candidatus Woesearchaeota archaeon]|nr:ATP-binding protein [Candidatus Woesearchaeota archaeon]